MTIQCAFKHLGQFNEAKEKGPCADSPVFPQLLRTKHFKQMKDEKLVFIQGN